MAYFAKLNSNNIVEKIISVNNAVITDINGIEQEQLGVDFINKLYNTNDIWKQTSYNTSKGIHLLGGVPFRKNYAGIGDIYDEQRDAFISAKPFNSWILNENTCDWEAPVPRPDQYKIYNWNEETLNWILIAPLDNN
jgi:hypothetical protein